MAIGKSDIPKWPGTLACGSADYGHDGKDNLNNQIGPAGDRSELAGQLAGIPPRS